jgi:hypothetical protein
MKKREVIVRNRRKEDFMNERDKGFLPGIEKHLKDYWPLGIILLPVIIPLLFFILIGVFIYGGLFVVGKCLPHRGFSDFTDDIDGSDSEMGDMGP